MTGPGLGLSPAQLAAVFPFHIAFDRALTIVQLGSVWARLCPDITVGGRLSDHFRLVRPSRPITFESLRAQPRTIFLLEFVPKRLPLRGQMLSVEGSDPVIFLCSPWVTDLSDLAPLGLSLNDLPAHQATADLLLLLQSKNTALTDAKQLAERLALQARHRQRAEEALQASEAVLRGIVDTAAEGIITIDERGIIHGFNAAAASIFGYDAPDVLGHNVSMLMPSPDREQHDAYLARYLQTGDAKVIGTGREVHGQRRDGSLFPLHLAVSEAQVGGKRVFTGIVRDLTEQARAAEAKRDSERRFRQIIDAALDAVISIDAAGRITVWSANAEAMFGWSAAAAVGRELADIIIPPQHREAHRHGIQHYLRTGEGPVLNRRIEITALHRNGREFPVELTVTPLVSGETVTFSAFVRDITERKRVELELAQAKQVAETASAAKSRFLAAMSHEIRTPLNPIIGTTGLLLSGHLDPAQRRHVERIRQSGHLLLQRINDILDFSKIEAHRVELEDLDFNVAGLLGQLRELLEDQANDKGLELSVQIAADVPRLIRGDPGRVQQVLLNLVVNAVKFTERGAIRVALSRAPNGTTLRFEVRDTGIGIPADKQAMIFDVFVQADSSTARHYGGSGLGLMIARELVELMGGHIGVESIPGQGSCFWFTLPLLPAKVDAGPVAAAQPHGPRPIPHRRACRILVAEDNSVNQEVIRLMLERLDQQVDLVSNGLEAIASFRRAAYDLVLMDCEMPEQDGLEATRNIRALEAGKPRTPIIAITAYAIAGDRERCLAAGMDDYLAKPVQLEHLVAVLDKWLPAVTSPAAAPHPVDYSALERLRQLESPKRPHLVSRLIANFLAQAPERIAAMQRTLAEEDWSELGRHAHDLKSDSGNLGARVLSSLCDELQAAARAGDSARCTTLVPRVAAAFEDARAALVDAGDR